jgi:hypothetical protein
MSFELISDRQLFNESTKPKISYAAAPLGGLHIPLFATDKWGESLACGEDIFQECFFHLSRIEEYNTGNRDEHGRYIPENRDYTKPWVNIRAMELRRKLQQLYPTLTFQDRKFKIISTIDIDSAWCFKNKAPMIQWGGLFRDIFLLRSRRVIARLQVMLGARDPFDVYDWLIHFHENSGIGLHFFWLLADAGAYDKNIYWNHPAQAELINKLASKYPVAIHPSYDAAYNSKLLNTEKNRLEIILYKKNVQVSRQHFLRMSLPETYRMLLAEGILEDHTMGFPDRPGFRAGICTPFNWFDMEANKETHLRIVPFAYMDGAFKHYMNISPQEAEGIIANLAKEAKAVNGQMVSLWHNESLSDFVSWKGWRSVYMKMKDYI